MHGTERRKLSFESCIFQLSYGELIISISSEDTTTVGETVTTTGPGFRVHMMNLSFPLQGMDVSTGLDCIEMYSLYILH